METAVFISVGILLLVLGGLLGVALGRYVWPAIRESDAAALVAAQMEAAKLGEECRSLRTQAQQLEAERAARIDELRKSGEEAARLSERVESLKAQVEEQGRSVRLLEGATRCGRGRGQSGSGRSRAFDGT